MAWILEQAWYMGPAMLLAAAVLWFHWLRQEVPRAKRAAIALAAGAVVLLLADAMITTDRQQLRQRMDLLLVMVDEQTPSREGLGDLLTDTSGIFGPDGDLWIHREVLVSEVDRAVERWHVTGHRVREWSVFEARPGMMVTEVRIRTFLGGQFSRPIQTRWRLTWVRGSDGVFRISRAEWLEVQNRPPGFGVWR